MFQYMMLSVMRFTTETDNSNNFILFQHTSIILNLLLDLITSASAPIMMECPRNYSLTYLLCCILPLLILLFYRTPSGLEDVSKYPDLFDKLAEADHGYEPWNREDLQKLAGLNLIRVFKEVENVRDQLRNGTAINDKSISRNDLIATNVTMTCRTNMGSGVAETTPE